MLRIQNWRSGRRWFSAAAFVLGMLLLALLLGHASAAGEPATLTLSMETNPDGGTGFPFTLVSIGSSLIWGGNGSGNGQFSYPRHVAVDDAGNVYVADTVNQRIQKFDGNGTFLTKWGSIGSGNGQFIDPEGMAADGAGSVYVADFGNNRIQKFDSNGMFLAKWGSQGSGDGQFNYPTHVAVDSAGNVYVADTYNHRIQKFDGNGTFLTKWGSNGSGDGQFSRPRGVALDDAGNVYVADSYNQRIQKFDSNGTFLSKWGGVGYGDGQFSTPYDVAIDSAGNVYVVDSSYSRIQKFDSNGTFLTKWGSSGSGNGQFNSPTGMTVDGVGNVYVADTNNSRIQKFVDAAAVLDDDESASYPLNAATYDITETVPDGWELSNIACNGGNPQISDNGVSVTLTPGADIECAFTNTNPAQLGGITIVKEVVGAVPGSDWTYTGDLGAFTLPAAGGETYFDDLDAGNFTINETAVTGYSQSVSCDSGEMGTGSVTLDLQPAEEVTCTFINTEIITPPDTLIYMTTTAAGTTNDSVAFGKEDILRYDGHNWSRFFDGSAYGLSGAFDINAIHVNSANDLYLSFSPNGIYVPDLGTVKGHDILHFNGSSLSFYFDGSDVGLTTTSEKIDALHILDGSLSPIGSGCNAYLLISTLGSGRVTGHDGKTLKFQGEDVLGFCLTGSGSTTTGLWHMVLDGSATGMPKNSTDSISANADGSALYLTTKEAFHVDNAFGGHSMVYHYAFATGEFSGPFFSAPAQGLRQKVDGLHVEGDLR